MIVAVHTWFSIVHAPAMVEQGNEMELGMVSWSSSQGGRDREVASLVSMGTRQWFPVEHRIYGEILTILHFPKDSENGIINERKQKESVSTHVEDAIEKDMANGHGEKNDW